MQKALEIAPDDVRILQNMAIQQRLQGDRRGSILSLEKAANVGGSEFVYPALLGLQLYDDNGIEEAEKWLSKVNKSDVNFAESRFRLAQISLSRGQKVEAGIQLNEAVTANPGLLPQARQLPELAALLDGDRGHQFLKREPPYFGPRISSSAQFEGSKRGSRRIGLVNC